MLWKTIYGIPTKIVERKIDEVTNKTHKDDEIDKGEPKKGELVKVGSVDGIEETTIEEATTKET